MQLSRSSIALLLCASAGVAGATDIANQDKRAYKIKVQGEGKLSVSTAQVNAGGTLHGQCGYAFCTFEIPGHKVSATRDARLTIRNGKFVQ